MFSSSTTSRNDLATLFGVGAIGGLSDAELLSRFLAGRGDAASEAAFGLLVTRHGPMVRGVCRRLLGDSDSAADAFQATFLILVRKAHAVHVGDSLGRWLHGVSLRVARRARADRHADRRRMRRLGDSDPVENSPATDRVARDELRAAIDDEIGRLPVRYRSAVVLCYLEGLTQEQAAGRLLCPVGTVESRLHRARERLRAGLARRGLAPAAWETALLATAVAKAEVPPSMVSQTVAAATQMAAGGAVSAAVASLMYSGWRTTMIRATLVSLGMIAAVMGIAVASSGRKDEPKPAAKQDTAKASKDQTAPRIIDGTILDPLGKPAVGATVVVGFNDTEKPNHEVLKTDENGHFRWSISQFPKGSIFYFIAASKEGLKPSTQTGSMPDNERESRVNLKLNVAEPMSAVLVDDKGKPVVGARVDVEMSAHQGPERPNPDGSGSSTMTSYSQIRRDVIVGSPLENVFGATTDRDGKFTLKASPGPWLKLNVTTADGKRMRVIAEINEVGSQEGVVIKKNGAVSRAGVEGFIAAWPKEPTRLVAVPTPRIAGRVTSKMPGVAVAGLKISTQESHPAGKTLRNGNLGIHNAVTDKDSRFVIDGFDEGTVNVFVHGDGEAETWTYRAAQDVDLQNGQTAEVPIELIPGIMAEGTVMNEKGTPVAGAWVGVYGPFRPRSGAATKAVTTDAKGRFHFRLPPGETYFYVMNQGANFIVLPRNGSSQTVTIPEGKAEFSIPPIGVTAAVALHGKVIDARGEPVPRATIVGVLSERLQISPGVTPTPAGVSDLLGEFRLAVQNHSAPPGKRAILVVRLADNREFQLAVTPTADGTILLKLPEK